MMLRQSDRRELLIDSQKFGRKDFAVFGTLEQLQTVVVDAKPKGELLGALERAGVRILTADKN
jgi:DeoR/GlpR family transcriptional regulator of sugar metabolism